jgi:DHA3 family macrolide efflux protein-like MFS transporter
MSPLSECVVVSKGTGADNAAPLGRTFWSLWTGQTISQFGSLATGLSIVVWLQDLGAKPGVIGTYFSFASVVIVVAGIAAGPLSDRASRRAVILATDAAALCAVLVLAMVASSGVGLGPAIVAAFIVRGVVVGSFSLRFPSIMTEISNSVPAASLKRAQSLYGTARQLAGMVGEASGGAMYAYLGRQLVFLVDAFTYAISIFCTRFGWRAGEGPVLPVPTPSKEPVLRRLGHDLRQGLNYVRGVNGLVMLISCMIFLNIFFSPLVVWLPFLVREQLGDSAKALGWTQAALGLGMLGGSLAAGFLRLPVRTSRQIALCLGSLGASFVAVSLALTTWQVAAAVCVLGLCVGFFNIVVTSRMQAQTPIEYRGRVFALTMTLGQVANPLAQGAVGFLAQRLNGEYSLIPLVTGLGTWLVVVVAHSQSSLRSFLDDDAGPV